MEIKSRKLVLSFGTALDTNIDITITNPAEELTPEAIKEVMNRIVTAGAVGEGAIAESVNGARYVIQQVDELDLSLV